MEDAMQAAAAAQHLGEPCIERVGVFAHGQRQSRRLAISAPSAVLASLAQQIGGCANLPETDGFAVCGEMTVLRQLSLISLLVFLLSALVMLDFKAAQRAAATEGRDLPSVPEHLLGIGPRILAKVQSGFGDAKEKLKDRIDKV